MYCQLIYRVSESEANFNEHGLFYLNIMDMLFLFITTKNEQIHTLIFQDFVVQSLRLSPSLFCS